MIKNEKTISSSHVAFGCIAAGYIILKPIAIYKNMESNQLDLIFLWGLLGSEVYLFRSSLSKGNFYKNTGRGIFIGALIILFVSKLQDFLSL